MWLVVENSIYLNTESIQVDTANQKQQILMFKKCTVLDITEQAIAMYYQYKIAKIIWRIPTVVQLTGTTRILVTRDWEFLAYTD